MLDTTNWMTLQKMVCWMKEDRQKRVYTEWFHLHKILRKWNWIIATKCSLMVAWKTGWEQEGGIKMEHEEIWGQDEYIIFDCGDGFKGVYICQNLPRCTFYLYIYVFIFNVSSTPNMGLESGPQTKSHRLYPLSQPGAPSCTF